MTSKREYFVMMGGGIGECQTTKTCTTPLQAISAWVLGQSKTYRYAAPMDTWINTPGDYDWDIVTDVPAIRAFYAWCEDHEDRLRQELHKQDVYFVHYLLERINKESAFVRDSTDEQIIAKFEYEHLYPFSGG
jgi:hypothetical protein